jgi:ATP/maltotriose-dependent transcriptional regulator MalT
MWQGDWTQAECELVAAHAGLMVTRAGWAPDALARLGELRRRQGRLDEADDLYKQVPTHPQALLGQAELALSRGDAEAATDAVERYLRRVPRDDLTEHVVGLEVAVRVHAAHGALDRAGEALAGLVDAAGQIGTLPLSGSVRFAQGIVSRAEGDDDAARQAFEDAIDLFSRSGAPYETALARLELAETLATLARTTAAVVEGQAALEAFQCLGADGAARRASELLQHTGGRPVADDGAAYGSAGLTRRETEVLLLVAHGRSNQEIADALYLSVRTVERHVSTIYQKIGAQGRAARAIATAYAIEHGLTTPQTA